MLFLRVSIRGYWNYHLSSSDRIKNASQLELPSTFSRGILLSSAFRSLDDRKRKDPRRWGAARKTVVRVTIKTPIRGFPESGIRHTGIKSSGSFAKVPSNKRVAQTSPSSCRPAVTEIKEAALCPGWNERGEIPQEARSSVFPCSLGLKAADIPTINHAPRPETKPANYSSLWTASAEKFFLRISLRPVTFSVLFGRPKLVFKLPHFHMEKLR